MKKILTEKEIFKKFTTKNDYINWSDISSCASLRVSFIEKYKNMLNWDNISKYQKLSEFFIEKFKNRVNWSCISMNQKLSESFIEKYKDKVDWWCISKCQKLSESFVIKMKKYIVFIMLKASNINKVTSNIINNCYECIKEIDKRKLRNKSILPEVRLYYEVK